MPVQEAATTVADDGKTELDTETTLPRARISGAPTLELVAAESGVSRSTVSRVVNGSPKVRPEVVEAVNAAIERLNYVPNRAARSLASRQTYAIALLVPERVTTFFNDPFFASVVQGITDRMEDSDYILNLLVSSSDPTRKTRRYLRGGNVDGAFVVSHHAADRDLADLCDIMPVVFGGRPAPGRSGVLPLRRHRQRARRPDRGRAPGRVRTSSDRDHHRAGRHARRGGPAQRLARWPAVGRTARRRPGRRRLHRAGGRRSHARTARRLARSGRRVRGQRPDGAGRPARAGRRRPFRSRRRRRGRLRRQPGRHLPAARSCPPWPSRRS